MCLCYENLGADSSLKLVVYADAVHGNLLDGGSQGEYFIFLVGQNRKCSLLSWKSKKIQRTVRSTLAAETLSLSNAVDVKVMPSFLLQSDGDAFTHMIMVSTFTIGCREL